MKIFIWLFSIFASVILIQILWYYFKEKLIFWWSAKKIRKMSDKYPGVTGEMLKKIAKDMEDAAKMIEVKKHSDE